MQGPRQILFSLSVGLEKYCSEGSVEGREKERGRRSQGPLMEEKQLEGVQRPPSGPRLISAGGTDWISTVLTLSLYSFFLGSAKPAVI